MLGTREGAGSADPRVIALQYRRARIYLGVALFLLAGTVLYLVAIGGQQIHQAGRTEQGMMQGIGFVLDDAGHLGQYLVRFDQRPEVELGPGMSVVPTVTVRP